MAWYPGHLSCHAGRGGADTAWGLRRGLPQLKECKAAFVASWLAVWLATVSFGPRTLLAGWMCLVAELFILAQFKAGKDRTWLLPPLFVLSANLHGSWLIGMVCWPCSAGQDYCMGHGAVFRPRDGLQPKCESSPW